MDSVKLIVSILLSLVSCVALAKEPIAVGNLGICDPGASGTRNVSSAKMRDKICFDYFVIDESNRELPVQINVYDGKGKEAVSSTMILSRADRQKGHMIGYSPSAKRDAPGTWWFVVALDGNILLSMKIDLTLQ